MKFWRHSLIATISFIAVTFSVVYTSSCTDDACTKVKCRNKGTCVDGFCKCPTGWEGLECQVSSVARFMGRYDGTTTTDGLPPVIDSAYISYVPKDTTSVFNAIQFVRQTRSTDTIVGYLGTDGKVVINDPAFGGRKIMIIEENGRINFNSIEINNGKEQTIKFTGTKRKE